jgi:hypothetical protein|tara:strand:- start:37 stop:201 length:165 start_codon:yes stop_codon:yes gene_type:complete
MACRLSLYIEKTSLQIASKYYVFFMMLSNGPAQIKNTLFVESTKLIGRGVKQRL